MQKFIHITETEIWLNSESYKIKLIINYLTD